jgi:hypothetical protein
MHYFDFDQGLPRAVPTLETRDDLDVFTRHEYLYKPEGDLDLSEAAALFNEWQKDWLEAFEQIKANDGGVLVIDTETQWVDLVTIVKTNAALRNRMAKRKDDKTGGVDHIQRLDYGDRNAFIEKMMLSVAALPNTRLVLVSRAGPVFDGAKQTDRMVPNGYKFMDNVVDLRIQCIGLSNGITFHRHVDFDGFNPVNNKHEFKEGEMYPAMAEELGW